MQWREESLFFEEFELLLAGKGGLNSVQQNIYSLNTILNDDHNEQFQLVLRIV